MLGGMGMAMGLHPAAWLIHLPSSRIQIAAYKAWRSSRTSISAKLGLPRHLLTKGKEVWIERDRLNPHIMHRI